MATISKENTQIDYHKTIGELSSILSKHGATQISIDYQDGLPIGLDFAIKIEGQIFLFQLPCNWPGVLDKLKLSTLPKSKQTRDQAIRVGWRIIKDWVVAQLALIDSGAASTLQAFLPCVKLNDGQTFFEKVSSGKINNLLN